MARTWQLGVQEVRPGTYFRTSSGDVTVEGAINGIVAVVYKGNWGTVNQVVDISPEEMNNLEYIVGTDLGYETVRQAFLGGAKMVRAIRVGATGTGKAARVNLYSSNVTNTVTAADGTVSKKAAGALKVWSRCPTTRTFTVSVNTDLATGRRRLTVYEGTRVVETFTVPAGATEAYDMYNEIRANGKYFTATYTCKNDKGATVTKCKIQDYAQKKFDGRYGENPTVSIAAYSAALDILEGYNWNVVIAASNAGSVYNLLTSYIHQCYEVGKLGMTVIGGLSTTPLFGTSDNVGRVDYATAINDWRVVYVLSGWLGTDGASYGGYKAVARVAGMIAGCETNASITHLVIQGAFRPIETLTNGQIIQAEEGGCLVLTLNEDGQVWVDNAINTLVTLGNDQDEGWKKIRRTKCRFELMSRINRTCDKLVGRLNNDANGRATILTAMTTVIREMIAERKLFEGSYAEEDSRYKPVGDRAYFILHIGDIDSLEKIYLDYVFSYANPFSELDVVTTA